MNYQENALRSATRILGLGFIHYSTRAWMHCSASRPSLFKRHGCCPISQCVLPAARSWTAPSTCCNIANMHNAAYAAYGCAPNAEPTAASLGHHQQAVEDTEPGGMSMLRLARIRARVPARHDPPAAAAAAFLASFSWRALASRSLRCAGVSPSCLELSPCLAARASARLRSISRWLPRVIPSPHVLYRGARSSGFLGFCAFSVCFFCVSGWVRERGERGGWRPLLGHMRS